MATLPKLLPVATLLLCASACDQDLQTIGPEGGIVTSPDGRVTLEIPAGALEDDVVVTIDAVDEAPDGAVGLAYEIEPRLTTLRWPAELVVDLQGNPEQRTRPLSDMRAAVIVTQGAEGWMPLPDLEVDPDAGLATASVLYFSTYAVVAD